MKIHSYGVFMSSGVPYLHQTGGGKDCIGLKKESPFKLELAENMKRFSESPHMIDLSIGTAPSPPAEFLDNPLVDLFLPKPILTGQAPRIVYIKDNSMMPFSTLRRLSRLSALDDNATVVYERDKDHTYRAQLRLTNLGPLSLVAIPKSDLKIFEVVDFATICSRNLILTGDHYMPWPAAATDMTEAYHEAVKLLKAIPASFNMAAFGSLFFKQWIKLATG